MSSSSSVSAFGAFGAEEGPGSEVLAVAEVGLAFFEEVLEVLAD